MELRADETIETHDAGWTRGRALALWAAALVVLLAFLGRPALSRTQEGRVLEVARQMLGRPARAWLIPTMNGEVRLRKPPLPYWLSAASFEALGVSEFAGRLPTAVLSWLTLAAVHALAARRFGRRAGVIAAAALLGSYLFARHGRLAETDLPATLFATLAVHFFWQAVDASGPQDGDASPSATFTRNPKPETRDPILPLHLGALCSGLAFFSKGGPGFFPLLFLIAYAAVRRRPRALLRFLTSGAALTMIVVAAWWYAAVASVEGVKQFREELATVAEGEDHPGIFLVYVPLTLMAAAPWPVMLGGAVVAAAERCRRDARLTALLLWAAAVVVPLCAIGNKQVHYLLPLMPALAVLLGWLVDAAARGDDPALARAVRALLGVTAVGTAVFLLVVPFVAWRALGRVVPIDVALPLGMLVAGAAVYLPAARRGIASGTLALAAVWAVLLALAINVAADHWSSPNSRQVAQQVEARFGDGPYVFLGGDTSLPLCFNLRREIRRGYTADEVRALVPPGVEPVLVQQVQTKDRPDAAPALPPDGDVLDVGAGAQRFLVYRADVSR